MYSKRDSILQAKNQKEGVLMEVSFYSLEDGYDKLMYMVRKRKQLEGTFFYEGWVQDCRKFADKLTAAGADPKDITAILGLETDKGCYYGILVR